MKPKFLFVKLHRVTGVTKKQAVFDQYDSGRPELESGMRKKQLVREDQQVQVGFPFKKALLDNQQAEADHWPKFAFRKNSMIDPGIQSKIVNVTHAEINRCPPGEFTVSRVEVQIESDFDP